MTTATYSAEDDKLRIYPLARLDAETYGKVKAAGFSWAPRQELFVQVWTPEREDVARELAGEIDEEDTSRSERADDRAERFEAYSERWADDAEAAREAVSRIADGIPLGQPILVGHHSERHARRDAKRIESGMRRAVENWKTSEYWTRRAAGVTSHAERMERPDVRARRVKTLEADLRKSERSQAAAELSAKLWSKPALTIEQARALANVARIGGYIRTADGATWSAWDVLRPDGERYAACPSLTVPEVVEHMTRSTRAAAEYSARWIAHLSNRLTFERAMLAVAGYEEPVKTKSPKASLPILNYPGRVTVRNEYQGTVETSEASPMTKAEYARIGNDYKGTRISGCGTHKVRVAIVRGGRVVVFLTDSKTHALPNDETKADAATRDAARAEAAGRAKLDSVRRRIVAREENAKSDDGSAPFAAMAESLRSGVAVVAVSQLFPTPAALADRMVELAEIGATDRVLEPSAGTGALLDAIKRGSTLPSELVAVEINGDLADRLEARHAAGSFVRGDFLACGGRLGEYERIVMNPPFGDAADILHIQHALDFLTPGGRIVALCAAGPRQEKALRPLASSWETLDAGTFAGTNVRAALLVIDKAVTT